MKWNTEWVDLQNIERMIAECWRMGRRQFEKYCISLSRQQDLAFASELGMKFLGIMQKAIDNDEEVDWPKLQRDIRLMKELIQDGQSQNDFYWKNQYHVLKSDTAAYFSTEFGQAFAGQLADKLELDLGEEQRMLRHDIQKIQKICASCDWEDEEKAHQELSLLAQEEKYYFSSWLGDAFIKILEERYGTKEEAAAPDLEIQQKPQESRSRKASLKAKLAWTFFICISVGMISLWLYLQSQGGESWFKLHNIISKLEGMAAGRVDGNDIGQAGQADETSLAMGQENAVLPGISQDRLQLRDAMAGDVRYGAGEYASGETDAMQTIQVDDLKADQAQVHADQAQSQKAGQAHAPPGQTGGLLSVQDGIGELDDNTADTGIENARQPIEVEVPDILPEYQSFRKKYPDLFGWLKISGTEIDHPVMQADAQARGEPYYYLHRDYTGKRSEAGSLFVEEKSSLFPQDDNTVIYGHNMSNGHNFGMLEKYKEQEFYEAHPKIQYDTVYQAGTYQIAAVLLSRILYQEEKGFRYYRFYNYGTYSEFQECVDFVKENRLYDTGVELQYGDQLLMLSTCEYSSPNGRLVVVAKKIG